MPLLWLSIAFVAGLFSNHQFPLSWQIWAGLAGGSILLCGLEKRFQWFAPRLSGWYQVVPLGPGVLLVFFCLGGLRFCLSQPGWTPRDVAWYNATEDVELMGIVDEPPDRRENLVLLVINTEEISISGEEPQVIRGKILLFLPPLANWQYGDVLKISGDLQYPPDNEAFSYRAYLAQRGINSYMQYPFVQFIEHENRHPIKKEIFKLKERAYAVIHQIFPHPESALLSGILLGIENDIPADIERAFQDTGAAHVIAISGSNIAVLVQVLALVFSKVIKRRWHSLAMTILVIWAYSILVGGDAAVIRAAIMGIIGLFGREIGRGQSGINSLAFVAAIMCAFNPLLLWDIGFQLSFSATFGLVYFGDRFKEGFEKLVTYFSSQEMAQRFTGLVTEYLLLTLAAQITTFPLIIYHFEKIGLNSLLVNLLILPAQPLLMISGAIAVVCGLVYLPLGQLVAWLAWPFLAYTIQVVQLLAARWNYVLLTGKASPWLVALFFFLILLAGSRSKNLFHLKKWVTPAILLVTTGLLSIGIWRSALLLPGEYLRLSVLNTSSGPVYLVQTPQGHNILINSASSANQLSKLLSERISFTNRQIDYLILGTASGASLDGLPVFLERFEIRHVLWNGNLEEKKTGQRTLTAIQARNIPFTYLQSGQKLQCGADITLQVIADEPDNITFLLQRERFRTLLLTGRGSPVLFDSTASPLLANIKFLVAAQGDTASAPILPGLQTSLILWDGKQTSAEEGVGYIDLDNYEYLTFSTDGQRLWSEAQR